MNEKKKLRRLPKRILSFVLTLAMVLTLMPGMSIEVKAAAASSGYITDEHGCMEYRLNDGNIYDFKGYINGDWKQVTYGCAGFNVGVYKGNGLSVTSTPSFIADGQAIMITYTVENTGSSSVSDCRFYIAADTMIDDNDASSNTISDDVVVMTNQSTGVSFFALSSTEGGTAVATEYRYAAVSYTNVIGGADPSTVTSVASAGDSAFVMYFPKETITAGEKRKYTLIVGMGDASSIDTIISNVKKALNASLDYANEKITDLEPGGKYEITIEDGNEGTVTYKVTASADGTIPLKGTDDDGKEYDLIGKKATIIQKGDGENTSDSDPVKIDVAGRPTPQDPDVPTNTPSDIDANDVETTTNSIKVKAVDGQEYRIGTDGPWSSPDEDGYVTFSGLDQLTEYTIYTRVKATSSAPASVISDGVTVKTQGMFAPTKTEYNGPYDGLSHELKVDANVEGATVTYSESLNGSYNSETFSFKDSGEHKVYYCISKENYYNAYGILIANISNSGHIFSYSADDNKITAKCTDNNCIYHEDGVSLTLTASSANYSGTTVTYSDDGTDAKIKLDGKTAWTGAGLSCEVKYYTSYTDEATNTPTSSTNGGASGEGAAPKDAGNYIVVLKAKEGDDVKKTLAKSFSINAVTITSDFITLEAASKEYTGAEITNAVTVKDGLTTLAVGTDYTVTGNKGTAKGEYTVSVTGKGNYKGTATKKWNITGEIPTITTNPTAGTITYGQKLSDSTLTGGVAKKGETVVPGTFAWKTPDVAPKVSDSGSTNYKIVFTPTDTENYGTVEFDAKVMVNKKTLTAKILNQTALKTADATYAITKDMIVLGAILNEDKGKVEVDTITGGNNPSIATAGTYDITATGLTLIGDASANYQVTSVTNGTLTVKEPTGGVQINNTDLGSVFVEVNKEDELPTTSISNVDKELASALLDDTDETYVTGGQNALIYLDLKDGDNLASAGEISKIETAVTAGEKKGKLLDLSLYKKIGGAEAVKITDISSTSKKVEVSIQVSDLGLPPLAAGYTRTYSIIRLHGTTAERLNVTVVNGKIKFATDKFSLYQILYKDASNGGGGYNPTVLATEVKIDTPSKTELTEKGETLQLTASITPSNTTNKTLTWKSSDEAVVTVDSTGKVTAVGDGTATITVSTSNGKTTTIEITVKIRKDNDEEKPSEDKPSDPITATEIAKNTLTLNAGLKVSQTGKKINVVWGKVADADGYLVYATYCGTNFGSAIKTIKNPTTTSLSITKLNGKAIDLKKSVKVYVKAYKLVDGKKVAFGKTITAHIVGSKNTKYTNVKEIKLTSKSSVTLAVGKTSTIKAKVVLVDAKKKQLSDSHAKQFRYASSNTKVATVNANGKITAKKKGTCYIYVYAKNGYAKKIKVTVK